MSQGHHHHHARRAFTRYFALFCLAGMVVGIALCLLQGQGAKAQRFAAAADTYFAQAQDPTLPQDTVIYLRVAAQNAALSALHHDAARPETWMLLSHILLQHNAHEAAAEARIMAKNMGALPVVAAPGYAAIFDPARTMTMEPR